MRKFVQVILLFALIAGSLSQPLAAITVAAPSIQRPTSLTVSLRSDPVEIIESVRDGQTFTSFGAAVPLQGEPGTPALPIVSQTVGIPTPAAPTVTYALSAAQPLGIAPHAIEPMPIYSELSETGEAGQESLTQRYTPDDAAYRSAGWYPAEPVRVSEVSTLRGQAMVRVEYSPIQVNLATGEIRFVSAADVTLAWNASDLTGATEVRDDPLWEDYFASTLSNYEEARPWRAARQPAAAGRAVEGGANHWMIRVEGEGLFKIPLSTLQGAGVDVSDPARLALYRGWTFGPPEAGADEQAIWIDGGVMYFINTYDHGFWSRELTYHLTVLPTPTGKRMIAEPSAPTQAQTLTQIPYTITFEEEHVYHPGEMTTSEDKRWFWDRMVVAPALPHYTITTSFDLPAFVPNTPASVFTELSPDGTSLVTCYVASAAVNGVSTGNHQWTPGSPSNPVPFGQTLNLAAGQIQANNNSFVAVGTHCPGNNTGNAAELVFNAINVNYQRYLAATNNSLRFDGVQAARNYHLSNFSANDIVAFEIAQQDNPTRLTGGTIGGSAPFTFAFGRADTGAEEFLVTTRSAAQNVNSITQYVDRGLRTDERQTDWILITHPDFKDAVQPLAAHRQSQGLTTRIVTVDDIYNDFGDGAPDPESIREFVKYAYQNWNAPAPSYLFIVGDGTYDPLDYMGTGAPTWVPPIFRDVDLYLGYVPADNAFVSALDPGDPPNQSRPDMHVGRLTPNSAAEVSALVNKIITYDNDPSAFNDWRRTLLLTADNADSAGVFWQLSERIMGEGGRPVLVPEAAKVQRAYYLWDPDGGGPLPPPYPSGTYPAGPLRLRDTIANTINKGALIVQYVGHGSPDQWGGEGYWTLRNNGGRDDIGLLTPTDRFAFGLPWTCWEGYFVHPREDDWSMAEVMTRQGDRGFIGSFSPTGLDIAEGHDVMTDAWYKALFGMTGETPTQNFGELVLKSKEPNIGGTLDRLTFAYMLYGDPASNLPVPPCLYGEGECMLDGTLFLPGIGTAP